MSWSMEYPREEGKGRREEELRGRIRRVGHWIDHQFHQKGNDASLETIPSTHYIVGLI
jgi:hypothetical protein